MTNGSEDHSTAIYDLVAEGEVLYPGFFTRQYMNFGYWDSATTSRTIASENLLRRLVEPLHSRKGRVLDVACGLGFTTRFLAQFWEPRHICGINLGQKQIEACRVNAPGFKFLRMDAARMGIASESQDIVLCVEAAFHFRTREDFFAEAHRVLRVGGALALSDVLRKTIHRNSVVGWHKENCVSTVSDYQALLIAAGFEIASTEDITERGIAAYLHYMNAYVNDDWRQRRCDRSAFKHANAVLEKLRSADLLNVICVAVKST